MKAFILCMGIVAGCGQAEVPLVTSTQGTTITVATAPPPKHVKKQTVVTGLPPDVGAIWIERNQKTMVFKDGLWRPKVPKTLKAKKLPKPAPKLEKRPVR